MLHLFVKNPADCCLVLVLGTFCSLFASCREVGIDSTTQLTQRAFSLNGETMGTTYAVKIVCGPDEVIGKADLQHKVTERLWFVEQRMSTYLPDSEVSCFNRSHSLDWFPVSKETAYVASRALRLSQQTGGAFDVTIDPLLDVWGFGTSGLRITRPLDAEVHSVKKRVGYHFFEVRLNPPALRKQHQHVRVNFSAIAKGYAVDQVASILDDEGVQSYLVEVGGEVKTKGCRADGEVWRVGIEHPVTSENKLQSVLLLSDRSLATSGDYRQFFEDQGRRFSHVIDPRTGFPVVHQMASVSVVHANCLMADALATAFMVMGPEDGVRYAEKHGISALFIFREGDGFREKMTHKFAGFVAEH